MSGQTGGKPIHFRQLGAGVPLVLIHGFCENSYLWEDMIPFLLDDFHLIIPDLPGFGESPLPLEAPFGIEDIASVLLGSLEDMGISEAVVIGHSLGGYVALAMLRQRPGFGAGLGLFHSTAYADSEEKKHTRDKTMVFIRKHGPKRFAGSFVPSLFSPENAQEKPMTVQRSVDMAASSSERSMLFYTQAMRDRSDSSDLLGRLKIPVLMIAGMEDSLVPLSHSQEQARLPQQCHAHFLERTGHMGMIERPKYCADIVQRFIPYCF